VKWDLAEKVRIRAFSPVEGERKVLDKDMSDCIVEELPRIGDTELGEVITKRRGEVE